MSWHTISKRKLYNRFQKNKPLFIRCKTSYSHQSSLASAFVEVGHFAPDEERLALSKPVVKFSFIYGVSGGLYVFVYSYKMHKSMFLTENSINSKLIRFQGNTKK